MSLKDRLAQRPRPSTTYRLRIDDDTAAREELAEAQTTTDAEWLVAAQVAVDSCYETVTITAMAPLDMEKLRAQHPPTDEQRAQVATAQFNADTFVPALLAACVTSDPVITEADWTTYMATGALTFGELNALFQTAWELNYRTPDVNLKKD